MHEVMKHPLADQLRKLSSGLAIAVSVLGVMVLCGWAADVPLLKSLSPAWVSMKANTALCFLLCGVALALSREAYDDRPAARRTAVAAASLVALIALATAAEYLFAVDLRLDQLLFREPVGTVGTFAPGRMALNTALCFVVIAASVLLLGREGSRRVEPAELGGVAVLTLAAQTLLGYALDADFSVGAGNYTRMAVHTAVAFLLAATALVCLRPERGLVGIITDSRAAGKIARRLVPAVALVPLVVGLLEIVGEQHALYDRPFGASLNVVLMTLVVATVGVAFARSLGRASATTARVLESLRVSEERLRATLHGIGDGVISSGAQCRVEDMNPAAERLTGWSVEEARGRLMSEVFCIVQEGSRQPLESPVERVLRDRKIVGPANHTLLVSRDGSERLIVECGAPIRAADGAISGVVLVFRDGTAERAQQEAQNFRAGLLESLDDAVVATDSESRITAWSRGAERLYGWSEEEAVGRSARELLTMESSATGGGDYGALLRSRGRALAEFRCRTKAGLPVFVELSIVALTSANGEASGYVGVHRDVTERNDLRAKLNVAERMASIGTLAAGVAHEINNPLAYVAANVAFAVEVLREVTAAGVLGPAQHGEVLRALEEAADGGERITAIVRDIKTFSRPDPEKSQCDLERTLEASISFADHEIRHRARLVRDFAPVPPVKASEARLVQVFLNLLVNAAHAIPPGAADANEIHVSTRVTSDGKVMVAVRDTGAGIAPDILARVFDPFFTTKAAGGGTGLGLAICHGIVTGLGGEIAVESALGAGTTFRVLLPAARARAASPSPAPPDAVAPKGRILIVDDELMVARALARQLGAHHEIETLADPVQALDRVNAGERFDIIFCDLMMPTMTGMDLHAAIDRSSPEQAARMVFVTGGAFTRDTQAFLDAMPGRTLEKPFAPHALRGMLGKFLAAPPREPPLL